VIRFERNVPADMAPDEADQTFENLIGKLCKGTAAEPGLMDLAGDPRYLPITELQMMEHSRTDPQHRKEIGDAWRVFLLVEWSAE
jgi:hypothetical protein